MAGAGPTRRSGVSSWEAGEGVSGVARAGPGAPIWVGGVCVGLAATGDGQEQTVQGPPQALHVESPKPETFGSLHLAFHRREGQPHRQEFPLRSPHPSWPEDPEPVGQDISKISYFEADTQKYRRV